MTLKVHFNRRLGRLLSLFIVISGFLSIAATTSFVSIDKTYAPNIPAPVLHLLSEKDTYITQNGAPSQNGDPTGWWLDQSGLGNHASYHILMDRRPRLLTNVVNGHSVVNFSVDDALTGSWTQSPSEGTVVYVFRLNDASNYGPNPYLLRLQGTEDHGLERVSFDWIQSEQLFRLGIRGTSPNNIAVDTTTDAIQDDGAWHVVTLAWSRAKSLLLVRVDGRNIVRETRTIPGWRGVTNQYVLGSKEAGGAAPSPVDVLELRVYNQRLVDSEISSIEQGLQAKYFGGQSIPPTKTYIPLLIHRPPTSQVAARTPTPVEIHQSFYYPCH